jgi:hypothetical protein
LGYDRELHELQKRVHTLLYGSTRIESSTNEIGNCRMDKIGWTMNELTLEQHGAFILTDRFCSLEFAIRHDDSIFVVHHIRMNKIM